MQIYIIPAKYPNEILCIGLCVRLSDQISEKPPVRILTVFLPVGSSKCYNHVVKKSSLIMQLHVTVPDPAETLHYDVEEKAEDRWSNEIKADDFSE